MDTHPIQLGSLLFLLGLLTGLAGPKLKNPRMGSSSHLEGVMNGMFLVILGLAWPRLGLSHAWLAVTFWLIVYAGFANWLATLPAAAWGAGALMNVSRGGLVDTDAAVAAHATGHLAGLALDVLDSEPIVPDALRALPRAILTPHVAFSADQSLVQMRRSAAGEVVRVHRGLPPLSPCKNPNSPRPRPAGSAS